MSDIGGWVAPGWEDVRSAFQGNFDAGREVGAAFAAYHRGQKVVDLWGGVADDTTGRPWEEDTMVLTYSSTKGATAMCANRLAEQGRLDVDAPVATYWPEFDQAGKHDVTVADLLSHRAGLPWVDSTLSLDEALAWTPVIEALERQEPVWPPGTDHGYHATTFGWLVGEVVRRVTGSSLGTYLRDAIAGPLGADYFIGLPASEEPRVARLVRSDDSLSTSLLLGDADSWLIKALTAPGGAFSDPSVWNEPRLPAAEIPAANGVGTARGLAALYGACVSDVMTPAGERVRVLGPQQLERALVQQTTGPDRVLGFDLQWGLGFMISRGLIALAGLGDRSFGHFGMGGSSGWADAETELGMAYVMNRMETGTTGDIRSFVLMRACVDTATRLA